jgi:eukaryotic-like serine/threonine-protein kinase
MNTLPFVCGCRSRIFAKRSHNEFAGQLSPDGKWLAYQSNESGRYEVYIRAFPGDSSGAGGKWQVSNQGGDLPRWQGDGKELFYVAANRLIAATIGENATSVQAGSPRELFSLPTATGAYAAFTYDVTADGQRFLVLEAAAVGAQLTGAPLTVIVNWQAGLKK